MNAVVARDRGGWIGRTRRYLSDDEIKLPVKEPTPPVTPGWQQAIVPRIVELLGLQDNWDSYGARRPSAESAMALLTVLASIMDGDTVAPSIVPTPGGHFQAEWHRNGADLEIEVVGPTRILVSFVAGSAPPWDEEISVDFTRLIAAVRYVGTP